MRKTIFGDFAAVNLGIILTRVRLRFMKLLMSKSYTMTDLRLKMKKSGTSLVKMIRVVLLFYTEKREPARHLISSTL